MATILIVDDDLLSRQFLVTLLGFRGHRVLEATDGAAALALVRGEYPHESEQKAVNLRLAALLEVSRQLAVEWDQQRLLEKFCHAARDVIGGHYAVVGMLDSGGHRLRPFLISGLSAEEAAQVEPPSPRTALLNRLLVERRPLRLRDLGTEPAAAKLLCPHPPACSFLGVTIASPSQVYGLLWFIDKLGDEEFSPEDEQVAAALAAQLAVAYENNRHLEGIQRQVAQLEKEAAERRQAEMALQENRRRLHAIFDNTQDALLLADDRARLVDANRAACTLLGLSRPEVVTRDVWDITSPNSVDKLQELWRTLMSSGSQEGEAALLRLDGSTIVVEYRAVRAIVPGVNLMVLRDVTKRKRAEGELQSHAELLQTLSRKLLSAQEAERRLIARELHDEIGQALTALKINLQGMQRLPAASGLVERIEEDVSIVERTLQQVRNLSLDLRPSMLDDLGLVAALRWYVDRQAQRAGFTAQVVAEPSRTPAAPKVETACFRVAQEALTNVVRHAAARQVQVELYQNAGTLHLVIRDDGAGFDVAAARARASRGASLGLLGMQERVSLLDGRLEITSAPGSGTEIHARFPLTPPWPAEEPGVRSPSP